MRLLHLHSGNMMGGIETVLLTLCDHADAAPLEHAFGLAFEGPLSDRLAARALPTSPLGAVRLSRPWTVRSARARTIELIRASRPDVIMVHSAWAQAVFGICALKTRIPLALYQHDLWTGRPVVEKLARRTLPDLIIANSRFTASTTRNLYPNIEPGVVHCPSQQQNAHLDPTAIARVRSELSTPANAVVFIQVARPDPSKGLEWLLRALVRLPADPAWMCWFVGGAQTPPQSAYLHRLRRFTAQRELSHRVRFLGQRSDVPALLAAADVCCHPTLAPESFGLVLIEAMSAGLPVIASAGGGATEILNERTGVLVPPADEEALVCAMTGLLRDPEARKHLGSHGPARARELCEPRRQIASLHRFLADHLRQTPGTGADRPKGI